MTILEISQLPPSPQTLPIQDNGKPFFIFFLASNDPVTKEPWCSDVRAALPVMQGLFDAQGNLANIDVQYVEVGQKVEWKIQDNMFRTTWGLKAVPSLVRYEKVGGEVVETGKMIEGELLDEGKVAEFVRG